MNAAKVTRGRPWSRPSPGLANGRRTAWCTSPWRNDGRPSAPDDWPRPGGRAPALPPGEVLVGVLLRLLVGYGSPPVVDPHCTCAVVAEVGVVGVVPLAGGHGLSLLLPYIGGSLMKTPL